MFLFLPENERSVARGLVRVAVYAAKNRQDKKLEGQVLFIKERSSRPYVGILQIVDKQAYVITESKNMPYDIHVQKGTLSGARNGQKVAALVTDWDKRGNFPIGNNRLLGTPGETRQKCRYFGRVWVALPDLTKK